MDWARAAKAARDSVARQAERDQRRRSRPLARVSHPEQPGVVSTKTDSDSDYQEMPPKVPRVTHHSAFLDRIRDALRWPEAIALIKKAIIGALEQFPNIARAVQSHHNAVLLMNKIQDKTPIDRRSLIANDVKRFATKY